MRKAESLGQESVVLFGVVALNPRPGLSGNWVRWILFGVSGALLGAATVAPWVAVPRKGSNSA